ncbi:MAG: SynChlorMet cassette protein ScmC [Syntrophobacterales bacterium]|nr:SynChlorMet cassette protein ScmC [Syntrophobacterales bacterium]
MKDLFDETKAMYELSMDDRAGWVLQATAEAKDWLERFSVILGLSPSAGCGYAETVTLKRAAGMRPGPGASDRPAWEGVVWDFRRVPGAVLDRPRAGQEILCLLPPARDEVTDLESMRHVLLPLYLEALRMGGFPAHAALVERNGRGVLLAGRGGIGKSTCCRRLPPPWRALADDLALVIRDDSGYYRAHALPTWSDLRAGSESTWDVRRSVPLEAIFFLDQSEADEATPAGRGEAAVACRRAAMEVFWSVGPFVLREDPMNIATRAFENAVDFSLALPAYRLRVSLTGRFWEKIEEVLEKGDSPLFRGRGASAHGT